jgi:hypothetical protein
VLNANQENSLDYSMEILFAFLVLEEPLPLSVQHLAPVFLALHPVQLALGVYSMPGAELSIRLVSHANQGHSLDCSMEILNVFLVLREQFPSMAHLHARNATLGRSHNQIQSHAQVVLQEALHQYSEQQNASSALVALPRKILDRLALNVFQEPLLQMKARLFARFVQLERFLSEAELHALSRHSARQTSLLCRHHFLQHANLL